MKISSPPPHKLKMVRRWADKLTGRLHIEDFWEWFLKRHGAARLEDIDMQKALDEYHGINRAELEKQRRSIVDALR